ncbi:hypothetical protein AAG570_012839 [Ranatra chinensis]|uniref:Bis(5'-nucleosyl)-tetraphosphatase [asymmetrical] n=1 Tax=Ranatra chinensis TaxID=642074 RepID=A0ABD0YF60_9HEMI
MAVRAAGFVIFRRITDHVEYLLLQASYGDRHWSPPKGHVENNENDMETALRETMEECGVKRDQLQIHEDFKRTLKYSVKGWPKEVVYWLAEVIDKNVFIRLSEEHQCYRWATLDEARELSRYSEMQDLLAECDQYLKK